MDCPSCGNSHIRRSRLRLSDFPEPIIGRLPMRCIEASYVGNPETTKHLDKNLGPITAENHAFRSN
jgi:hypothetical protein